MVCFNYYWFLFTQFLLPFSQWHGRDEIWSSIAGLTMMYDMFCAIALVLRSMLSSNFHLKCVD
jgi:hypothetical protein